MTDEFDAPTDIEAPASVDRLAHIMQELLVELRRLQHPAFEAKLLEQLQGEILRQNRTTDDLRELYRELHHTMMWLKKHIGELARVMRERGIPVDDPDKPG